MAIEILDEPQIQVNEGITYHVYAIEQLPEVENEHSEQQGDEQERHDVPRARAIGLVAIAPSSMARYIDDDRTPYMVHDVIKVQGIIDDEAVYDKTISPRGFLGARRPFYGLRIGIAKRRAAHRVKSLLSA